MKLVVGAYQELTVAHVPYPNRCVARVQPEFARGSIEERSPVLRRVSGPECQPNIHSLMLQLPTAEFTTMHHQGRGLSVMPAVHPDRSLLVMSKGRLTSVANPGVVQGSYLPRDACAGLQVTRNSKGASRNVLRWTGTVGTPFLCSSHMTTCPPPSFRSYVDIGPASQGSRIKMYEAIVHGGSLCQGRWSEESAKPERQPCTFQFSFNQLVGATGSLENRFTRGGLAEVLVETLSNPRSACPGQ